MMIFFIIKLIIVLLPYIGIYSVECLLDHNWCNTRYLSGKPLPSIRFIITSVTMLVHKTWKFYKNKSPQYLFQLIPEKKAMHMLQETLITFRFKTRHSVFKNSLSFYNNRMKQFRSYPSELKKFCFQK